MSLRDLAAGDERAVPQQRFAWAKVHRGEGGAGVARCLCCSAADVTGAQLEAMPFFLIAEDKVSFLKTPKALKTFFFFFCLRFRKNCLQDRSLRSEVVL